MITLRGVKKTYSNGVQALRGVDLDMPEGKTTALVGESGCGKSTLAKVLMGLERQFEGEVLVRDRPLSSYTTFERAKLIQLIYQDPSSSLNPRHQVREILREPLVIRGEHTNQEIDDIVQGILSAVGFDESILAKYPHMFSGGQKQRIVLARALVLRPEVLICDEPVSALDVSVQAQILNLLVDLQKKFNLTYLFISHDLHVVKWVSHQVYVMYLGQIVEHATKATLFANPAHPYSDLLLESTPHLGQAPPNILRSDDIHSLLKGGSHCAFSERCSSRTERCLAEAPSLEAFATKHEVRCFNPRRPSLVGEKVSLL